MDESTLTDESLPVEKTNETMPENILLADRRNIAFASILVTYGQATVIAIATGNRTEIGKVSELLAEAPDLQTLIIIV
ncbi:MAG: hypothetical protein A2176_14100 [Spirochaetes bacterium RBG_13_51_14]|nr:MAG: hypothetical protein A2176_14100 [Spirochaetes bacterium RBG_13_51_14]